MTASGGQAEKGDLKADGLVVVRGGGDLGTGVAHRLFGSGYRVLVLEVERPTVVRRTVAFAAAVTSGGVIVEGIEARLTTLEELEQLPGAVGRSRGADADTHGRSVSWPGWVPVLVDPEGGAVHALRSDAVVDARMAKVNLGTARDDAPVTIGLGPGFAAGRDVDFVVETARGHSLGRLITNGEALPDTGVPGLVLGIGVERVMRAPASGQFEAAAEIGDLVGAGDVVGTVGGVPVKARIAGLLRGLVATGIELREGQKLGDVDPRGRSVDPALISDKALSVAGAVLEGLLRAGVLPGRAS